MKIPASIMLLLAPVVHASNQDALTISSIRASLTKDQQLDTIYYEEMSNKKRTFYALENVKEKVSEIKNLLTTSDLYKNDNQDKVIEIENKIKVRLCEIYAKKDQTKLVDILKSLEGKKYTEVLTEVCLIDKFHPYYGFDELESSVKKWSRCEKLMNICSNFMGGISILMPVLSVSLKGYSAASTSLSIATSFSVTLGMIFSKAAANCGTEADNAKRILISSMNWTAEDKK